jgi:hypothetical protein
MCAKMTRERPEEFGAAWNSGDADLVTSFFALEPRLPRLSRT